MATPLGLETRFPCGHCKQPVWKDSSTYLRNPNGTLHTCGDKGKPETPLPPFDNLEHVWTDEETKEWLRVDGHSSTDTISGIPLNTVPEMTKKMGHSTLTHFGYFGLGAETLKTGGKKFAMSNHRFDPCELFPARIKPRRFTAEPIKKGGMSGSGGAVAGGATDLIKGHAYLPMANNAYSRTIRLHEALHGIYTAKPTKERIKSGTPYTILEQGLEDARLHANCARATGAVRRDELFTAIHDLKSATSKKYIDVGMAALIALRSSAILGSKSDAKIEACIGIAARARHTGMIQRLCDKVHPDYATAMHTALECIRRNEMTEAHKVLEPYFPSISERPEPFPSRIFFDSKGDEDGKDKIDADVSFAKVEGKLGSIAADLLCDSTKDALINPDAVVPQMHVHQLFAKHNVATFHGATSKRVVAGLKIRAKALATIVGPTAPRLFEKTIKRNGGSVLIDSSGSMSIKPSQLLKLVNSAPLATIAFYNAPTDDVTEGNLWIYAHQGKRANDLSDIRGLLRGEHRRGCYNWYGWGNVVDFQALQWLLAMPKPRYFLTDGVFTGPWASQQAGRELLATAIARKMLTQITSFTEMNAVLKTGLTKEETK